MRFTTLLAGLILLAGCSTSAGPDDRASVLMPLAVGNTWIGQWEEFDSSGARLRTYGDTVRVLGDTVINGERRALTGPGIGFVNRADGLYSWRLATGPELLFKYPTARGEYLVATPFGPLTVRIVATNESVTVPAGTFSCYHYSVSAPDSSFDNHFYYAPDVGNIRTVHNDRQPNPLAARAVYGLINYALK